MARRESLPTFEEWVGLHPSVRSWPEDRQRKAYNQYITTQQGVARQHQSEVTAYMGAYETANKNMVEAQKAFLAQFVQAVSGIPELRNLANEWAKAPDGGKSGARIRFPAAVDITFSKVKGGSFVQELAGWSLVFKWAKGKYGGVSGYKDKGLAGQKQSKYDIALSKYHGATDAITAKFRESFHTEVPAAVEKVRRTAPHIFAKIGPQFEQHQRLEQSFYDQTMAQANADDLASGKGRLVGTGTGGSGTPSAGPSSTTIGGYSLMTILVVLVVLGLLGYGIYYLATEM